MRRFFVDEIKGKEGPFAIKGQEAKHIKRVLRLGPGDRFILFDGKGSRFQAVIESTGSREVIALLEKPLPLPPTSPVELFLCQALLKSAAMDDVIRKTSELGVDRIFPFSSERTVIRLNHDQLPAKRKHWQEIAKSAAKQADRTRPAEIAPPTAFRDLIEEKGSEETLRVILWEGEDTDDLKGLLRLSPPSRRFIGFIGPEGGFTEKEIEEARKRGVISVSLGYRVLRADTAAMTMVALVQYEWGDLSLGNPSFKPGVMA